MFDSTPLNLDTTTVKKNVGNEPLARRPISVAEIYKRECDAERIRKPKPPVEHSLDLIALWDGGLLDLDRCIDLAIGWGPFELAEIASAFVGKDGRPRLLCRFIYHGAPRDRDQFEHALKMCLSQITKWEETDDAAMTSAV